MRRAKRAFRRRRKMDMQSVKFCNKELIVQTGNSSDPCSDPNVTQFLLATGDLYNLQPGLVKANAATNVDTARGLVLGGMTFDASWCFNAQRQTTDPLASATGWMTIWEAVHKASLDPNGFVTYIPVLSDGSIGADQDVDIMWKRVSRIPIFMPENDCGFGQCQMTAMHQNHPDHVRMKTKRRIDEHEAVVYSVSFVPDVALFAADVQVRLQFDAWFRLAVAKW